MRSRRTEQVIVRRDLTPVSPRNCLKDSAAYMSPVNVTQTINPEITDVWCHSVSGEQIFDRLHPGEDGFANGLAFADADKPKVDRLWLEMPDGKTAVEPITHI